LARVKKSMMQTRGALNIEQRNVWEHAHSIFSPTLSLYTFCIRLGTLSYKNAGNNGPTHQRTCARSYSTVKPRVTKAWNFWLEQERFFCEKKNWSKKPWFKPRLCVISYNLSYNQSILGTERWGTVPGEVRDHTVRDSILSVGESGCSRSAKIRGQKGP